MTEPSLEHRVTDLEIKLTYQDDLLKTLNDVIVELRSQLDGLTQRMKFLEQNPGGKEDERAPGDDVPPHY